MSVSVYAACLCEHKPVCHKLIAYACDLVFSLLFVRRISDKKLGCSFPAEHGLFPAGRGGVLVAMEAAVEGTAGGTDSNSMAEVTVGPTAEVLAPAATAAPPMAPGMGVWLPAARADQPERRLQHHVRAIGCKECSLLRERTVVQPS